MPGRPGTSGGLVLRTGQFVFAAACICAMASASGFTNYTAFCYLIASMGLQALWSLGLACLDCYALILKRDLQQAFLMSLFVVGDWVIIYDIFLSMFYFIEPLLFLLPSKLINYRIL